MDKKGNKSDAFAGIKKILKSVKRTYLYKLVTGVLSFICTIILIILLIVGAMMFYFNMKSKAYAKKGLDYTTPFGLYTIISGSMEPNVDIYDVVITVEEDIDKLKVGDIITFISTWDVNYGATVTHRVAAIAKNEKGEYQITTKGDNNQTADSAPVTQANLIGKVVGRLPQVGRLQFFLATKMGWFLVVFIPAIIVIILDMIKIFRLYVLKNELDNVLPPKEAEKKQVEEELSKLNAPIQELNNQELKPRAKKEKDDTVDTVELPKVDKDGVIKESTSDLPVVKDKEQHLGDTLFEIDLKNVVLDKVDETKETTIKMPLIRKKLEKRVEDNHPRKMLDRRKK